VSEDKDSPMSQHLRVLVADDEPLIRALFALAFEAEGYDVETAADGVEALEKACQQPPQVIVLDLMMPVMNGWDFLEAWQCQPASQAVPVVVISAGYRREQQPQLDVQGFLTKPFDLEDLMRQVQQATSYGQGQSQGSGCDPPVARPRPDRRVQ
jgi:two-component system chemotaxis response regulator CheY